MVLHCIYTRIVSVFLFLLWPFVLNVSSQSAKPILERLYLSLSQNMRDILMNVRNWWSVFLQRKF